MVSGYHSVMTDPLASFLDAFRSLDEATQLAWGKRFRDATGGTLSPFANPLPVAVALVPVALPDGGVGVLGVRRNIPPQVGGLAFPGGYIELGETVAQASAREVREETGVILDPTRFGAFGQPCLAGPSQLLFQRYEEVVPHAVFLAASQALDPAGESQELVILAPDSALCFPLHAQALSDLYASAAWYALDHGLSSNPAPPSTQGSKRPPR